MTKTITTPQKNRNAGKMNEINLKQYESAHRVFLMRADHEKGCELEAIVGMYDRGTMNKETFFAILLNFAAVLK